VIALSCDPLDKHLAWVGDIEETQGSAVEYPIIADASREVATLYNMLDKTNKDKAGLPLTVRSVFIIDPSKAIRLILTYPAIVGRNFDEVLRALDALQLTAQFKYALLLCFLFLSLSLSLSLSSLFSQNHSAHFHLHHESSYLTHTHIRFFFVCVSPDRVATPVNWRPGQDVIVPPSVPLEEAQAKYADLRVLKPYLRYTADPSVAK